jgi:hypothetical protein
MNNDELKQKIHLAASSILKEKNHIAPVDILIEIGILSVTDYENWCHGRVPYLEKICKTNLSKLSFIMKEVRTYAKQSHMKPSSTAYQQWGVKGRKIPLCFSKSGNPSIEEAYATHYIAVSKDRDQIIDKVEESTEDGKLYIYGKANFNGKRLSLSVEDTNEYIEYAFFDSVGKETTMKSFKASADWKAAKYAATKIVVTVLSEDGTEKKAVEIIL